ncbi:MAG: acyl-CoA dehydrogenase, partial [Phenylobacterium zucineum]
WFASKENIQVHGGMGFTWDVDCHLYYRRSRQLSLVAGAPKLWKERLVSQLEKKNAA